MSKDLSCAGQFRRAVCPGPPTHDFPQYNYRGEWKPTQCPACTIKRLHAELGLKTRALDRLPFCPDHRDKVGGKPCRECEIEHLQSLMAKGSDGWAYAQKMDEQRQAAEKDNERLRTALQHAVDNNARPDLWVPIAQEILGCANAGG